MFLKINYNRYNYILDIVTRICEKRSKFIPKLCNRNNLLSLKNICINLVCLLKLDVDNLPEDIKVAIDNLVLCDICDNYILRENIKNIEAGNSKKILTLDNNEYINVCKYCDENVDYIKKCTDIYSNLEYYDIRDVNLVRKKYKLPVIYA